MPNKELHTSHLHQTMTLSRDVILSEVLPKLPFKSLIRFKCVCKSFKTTISSFKFINDYLNPCLSSDVNRFLILPRRSDRLYSCNLDSQESPIITNLRLPSTFNRLSGPASVIGSCNGLLCISKGDASARHFILLNPSTKRFWEIPFFRFPMSHLVLNFGFGYDAANGDYKIVSFSALVCENNGVRMRGDVVYSLKAGSWRWVGSCNGGRTPLDHIVQWANSVVLLGNDLLHCAFALSRQSRICCFDIASETWRSDVMMPTYYEEHGYGASLHDLGVLDGCLCSTFENRRESNVDVWIMKEHGVSESWLRLLSISISRVPRKIYPIAYRKGSEDEVLLGTKYPTTLLWYNSSCDEIAEFERINKLRNLSNVRAQICIGSAGEDEIGAAI